MDMHSGGGLKEEWQYILIEAAEDEAKIVFYNRFGHDPDCVSCTCCGGDYSISEYKTLAQATAYDRGCRWDKTEEKYLDEGEDGSYRKYQTLEEYTKRKEVLIVYAKDIKPSERKGDIPEQGYVWVD